LGIEELLLSQPRLAASLNKAKRGNPVFAGVAVKYRKNMTVYYEDYYVQWQ
jgi:hypothetical protein